ncbi:piccolo [Acrasis kona]|uniref:Piccolo n=1 Tax=Acrasis kona TaxID=1008807 RepID=A0AAW2ZJX2_9EUKA
MGTRTDIRSPSIDRSNEVLWNDYADQVLQLNDAQPQKIPEPILLLADADTTTANRETKVISITPQCLIISKTNSSDGTDPKRIPFENIRCIIHQPYRSNEGLLAIVIRRKFNVARNLSRNKTHDLTFTQNLATTTNSHVDDDKDLCDNAEPDILLYIYRKLEFIHQISETMRHFLSLKHKTRQIPIFGLDNMFPHLRIKMADNELQEPVIIDNADCKALYLSAIKDQILYPLGNIYGWLPKYDDCFIYMVDSIIKKTYNSSYVPKVFMITDKAFYLIDITSREMDRRVALKDIERIHLTVKGSNSPRKDVEQQPSANTQQKRNKAHRLSIAIHSRTAVSGNNISSFALIVPSEYDMYLISERSTEIVNKIRQVQGHTSSLKYESDNLASVRLAATKSYVHDASLDHDHIKQLIKQGIEERSQSLLYEALQKSQLAGLDRDPMHALGVMELFTCERHSSIKSIMTTVRDCCDVIQLGEYLMKTFNAPLFNKTLFDEFLPIYKKLIEYEQFIYVTFSPLHYTSFKQFEINVLVPELKRQQQSNVLTRQALDRYQIDSKFCRYMRQHQMNARLCEKIDFYSIHNESPAVKVSIKQFLSTRLKQSILCMDLKQLQMLLHVSQLLGYASMNEASPRSGSFGNNTPRICSTPTASSSSSSSSKSSQPVRLGSQYQISSPRDPCSPFDIHSDDLFYEARKAMLNLEKIQLQKEHFHLGDDTIVRDLMLKIEIAGSYLSGANTMVCSPSRLRKKPVNVILRVDVFDKLGYFFEGPKMNCIIKPPHFSGDYSDECHGKLKSLALNNSRFENLPQSFIDDDGYVATHSEIGVINLPFSNLIPFCVSLHTHLVLSLEFNDLNNLGSQIDPQYVKVSAVEPGGAQVFEHFSPFNYPIVGEQNQCLCVLSRLVSVTETKSKRESSKLSPVLFSQDKVNWSILCVDRLVPRDPQQSRGHIGMLPPPSRMIVTVLAGRNLASRDWNGRSDPYCIIKYENGEYRSDKKNSTLNPVWKDQSFPFKMNSEQPPGELRCECWDHDMMSSDDFMGVVIINVMLAGNAERWYPLQADEKYADHGEVVGDLRLRIEFDYE